MTKMSDIFPPFVPNGGQAEPAPPPSRKRKGRPPKKAAAQRAKIVEQQAAAVAQPKRIGRPSAAVAAAKRSRAVENVLAGVVHAINQMPKAAQKKIVAALARIYP
jgi:hypothetical protein